MIKDDPAIGLCASRGRYAIGQNGGIPTVVRGCLRLCVRGDWFLPHRRLAA
jgi:hypothetical protein